MMQWLPLHLLNQQDAFSIIKTFREVFPHVAIWNSFLTRIVLLTGSNTPIRLTPELFLKRMQQPEVARAGNEMGVRSFLDLADFHITDADKLQSLLKNAPSIIDDRPLLEHSPVTLLPPFPQETDETFLNLLIRRVDQQVPVTGLTESQVSAFQESLDMRTAQRLSIFSQRYQGPGQSAFKSGQFEEGLEEIRKYLKTSDSTRVQLGNAGWRTTP